MNGKRTSETLTRMAQFMTPNDANFLGHVFGGSILAMVDLTASATAQKFSGRMCVTASFDRVDFLHPVEVGNYVEMEGSVTYVGRTSLEVTIDVYATDLTKGDKRHTNTARVTMVALDDDGQPTEVPRLICETREDRIAFIEGLARRHLRQGRAAQMADLHKRLLAASDEELDLCASDPEAALKHIGG
ncbi:MAG TPA: acyl-CoA thioesterase [Fimbriimonadaceae bacterium]|nr:acyl-CoA thioesterase [Fimbriimonadaceae bacterium]